MEGEQQHLISADATSSGPLWQLDGLSVGSLIPSIRRASVPSWPCGQQRGSPEEGPVLRELHSEGEVSDGGNCMVRRFPQTLMLYYYT